MVTLHSVVPEAEPVEAEGDDTEPPVEITLLYRFYSRAGYGTPEWDTNQWETLQDWSTINWVETSFDTPGNYFIAGHMIASGDTWADGDPQGGFNVVVE